MTLYWHGIGHVQLGRTGFCVCKDILVPYSPLHMAPGGMHNHIKITAEDAFASIVSGAIHDFDHPGFNNNFHVRTNAYLATLYNDRSVLESHHCASVFELMKNPKFNILQPLDTVSPSPHLQGFRAVGLGIQYQSCVVW